MKSGKKTTLRITCAVLLALIVALPAPLLFIAAGQSHLVQAFADDENPEKPQIPVDKTALNAAISAAAALAETDYTSESWAPFAAALLAANAVAADAGATQDMANAALSTLSGVQAALIPVPVAPMVDKTALNAAISAAAALAETDYTSESWAPFAAALAAAKDVAANAAVSQAEVDAAQATLSGAQTALVNNTATPGPTVKAVAIFHAGTENDIAETSINDSDTGVVQIKVKGQTMAFDSVVYWTDYARERNLHFVTWSTSDPSVATVSPAGLVTPLKDGTVEISATVPGSYVATSADLAAKVTVEIFGQSGGRYVTGIRIIDGTGKQYAKNSPYVLEESLATALVQFHAEVDVLDPASGETRTYSTIGAGGAYVKLSSQTETAEFSDISWYVGDGSTAAFFDMEPGMFRPLKYGVSFIYAETRATLDNTALRAEATVSALNPDGPGEDSYNPQPSITVKAYYELYPPEAYGEDAYVIDETYSVAEIEQMGTFAATYTALANSGYYTMTGRGVPFAVLLQEAGVNLAGTKGFKFGSADNYGYQFISKDYLFAARYYYPNIFSGFASYSDAVQVPPMLALESNMIRDGRTTPNYNMSEATRFRLFIGARQGDATSSYAIKWIHTIYVVLSGGPGTETGNGDGEGDGTGTGNGDGDDAGTDPGNGDGDGDKTGIGDGTDDAPGSDPGDGDKTGIGDGTDDAPGSDPGNGNGKGNGSGTDSGDGNQSGSGRYDGIGETGAGNTLGNTEQGGGREGIGETDHSDPEIGTGSENEAKTKIGLDNPETAKTAETKQENRTEPKQEAESSRKFNIYQVMNIHDSKTPLVFAPENPAKPYALPSAILIFVIGGISALLWYRRQSRSVWLPSVHMVIN